MKYVLIFLYMTQVHALSEKNFALKIETINKDLHKKISICNEQNEKIVKKGILRKNDYDVFIKDEKKALYYIEGFQLTKITSIEQSQYLSLIVNNCSPKNAAIYFNTSSKIKYCAHTFDEYAYLKALIKAVKNYDWSKETKEKAISKVLDYIKQEGANAPVLAKQMTSLSLLTQAAENNLIENKFTSLVKKTEKKWEKKFKKFKKNSDKETNGKSINANDKNVCSKIKLFKKELELSEMIRKDIAKIIKKTAI